MEKKRAEVMGSLSLLIVAIIWGSGFIASQMALDAQMSSAFIMFVRFAIAALIVGVVFHKDLKKNMKKEHIKGGLLIGTFLFLAFYVQTVALQYTTPSNNAFITAANVVIVPFLWWAISKKNRERSLSFPLSCVCWASAFCQSTFQKALPLRLAT